MKVIMIILSLFVTHICFAGDFDNPYMDVYRGLVKKGRTNLVSNPYFEHYNNLNELEQKYQQAREREQSAANKLLTAATIGMTGVGGMQLASGLAEQQADAAAEQDMRAYLATFMCDYGGGRNIRGGETNIALPNASDLLLMVTEYKQLASELKEQKNALNMLPGIESEIVFDAENGGVYDNDSVGAKSGAFTSLSRALMDENSADAAAWGVQKSSVQRKIKTGAIVGGVGAAGGAIGNLILNKGDKSENKK